MNSISLVEKAHWVWRETLKVNRSAPETRIASSLSPIEIFVALYYGEVMKFDAQNPLAAGRDRCIISKGHGSICMYPILADLGFFSMKELYRVCQAGSFLGGIPDPVIPGYETVNGSLGHGLGVGGGVAYALKLKNNENSVFVIVGDGELHEGANWEAMMFASHHRLDNLHVIVDDNRTSMLGRTKGIVSHEPLTSRMSAFGWHCLEVDGHDVEEVQANLLELKSLRGGKPKALIAKTLKGRGIPSLVAAEMSHVMAVPPEIIDGLLGSSK